MATQPKTVTGILIGKKAIMGYLNISRDVFYELIRQGLPAAIINNRYYAHRENIELWFQNITRTQPRQVMDEAD